MKLLFTVALLLPLAASCKGSGASFKEPGADEGIDIGSGVDARELAMRESLEKLVGKHRAMPDFSNDGQYLVAFVGLVSSGREELREEREWINDTYEEQINNAGPYRAINKMFIDRARKEAGLQRPDDMFIPKYRDKYVAVLEGFGQVPDYIIIGSLTEQRRNVGDTGVFGRDVSEVKYRFTTNMIDVRTGYSFQEYGEKTKEYKKR